ncbi:MAG: restriction endonuclease subunit S [Prevotellaceae bacterium]|nr:restriction endonuclease subunit S [Prevotellaceae bacterium]
MEKYTAYKPSGIKWIGDIPEHWVLINLKRVFSQRFSGTWGEEPKNNSNDRICLRVADFDYSNLRFKELPEYTIRNYKDDEICKYTLSKGSILIEKSGGGEKSPVGRSVFYDLKFDNALFANFLECLVVRDNYNPKFIVYYLSVMYSKRVIWKYVRQTTGIQNLTLSSLLSMESIYVPNISEQLSIVAFLEKATANIDAYIKQTEQEINTLNELKQAEIAEVVTKGINPNAPMKDSGIPWVGQIPEHWDSRFLFQVSKEHYISNKNVLHQNLLSLSYGKIVNKDINKTDGLLPANFDTYQVVEDGNLILRLTDLQNDHKSLRVGFVTQEGIITSAYVCLEAFNNMIPKYLYYSLHSFDIKKVFYSMGGGLRQGLNYAELRKLNVIVPPKEEQQQIVEFIESRVAIIEEQISIIKSEIEQMQEYKQCLISDAVTGKIKV